MLVSTPEFLNILPRASLYLLTSQFFSANVMCSETERIPLRHPLALWPLCAVTLSAKCVFVYGNLSQAVCNVILTNTVFMFKMLIDKKN